uniref:Uncharacterized protein n=1 Tax=Anguilla anguilla TaxID=7936 RepID=A0A0E9PYP8_ANGAN
MLDFFLLMRFNYLLRLCLIFMSILNAHAGLIPGLSLIALS